MTNDQRTELTAEQIVPIREPAIAGDVSHAEIARL
jgi:hypothetical protein